MIEDLYPNCLDIGISPSLFWDSSLQELYDLIESHDRKVKIENEKEMLNLKKEISLNGVLARLIGEHVASMFSKEASVTPLTELFPDLFKEEKEELNISEMELYKIKMQDFAERHNERRKTKGGTK